MVDAFVPQGTSSPTIVQYKQTNTFQATFDNPPALGNKVFCLVNGQQGIVSLTLDAGVQLTEIGPKLAAGLDGTSGVARFGYRDVAPGDPAGPYGSAGTGSNCQCTIFEVAGLPAGAPLNSVDISQQTGTGISLAITPSGGVPAWIVGGFASYLYGAFGGTPTFAPNGSTTTVGTLKNNLSMWGHGQAFYGQSAGGAVSLGGTQGGTNNGATYRWGEVVAAFTLGTGGLSWVAAPDTVDESDASSELVLEAAIGLASDVFWRADLGDELTIADLRAVLGFEDAGDVTINVQAGDASDWSDAATVNQITFDATGGFTADELTLVWDGTDTHRYWQLALDAGSQAVEVFEVSMDEAVVVPPVEPSKAILEIYVHDEDASRWDTATWATGAATGTEGIWSAAGWQDVTPEGVNAHIIWGSRSPESGILAKQNAASWNVETYDPERILDPGNFDGPFYPQLVAGVPIRISHNTLVIRTGYIDRIAYKHKGPDYRGQLLCTDTIALLNQAMVPEDSILGNTMIERVQDAISAAGVAVGGIPLPPTTPIGHSVSPLDTDNPRERSVWDHVTAVTEEKLFICYVRADAGLAFRQWGFPIDRGREITAANLEDLEAISHDDGLYSVVRVQGSDPDLPPIEREVAPLPRYGRRVYERDELTIEDEDWAAQVLQERSWPGVQYVPGTIHCFTAADVDYFGSLEIMERVTITVPAAVSVTGRILGGELFVEHVANDERGAKWQFLFAVATDGSSAIGLTTLVSSQAGDTLLDSQTGIDYLEAD